MLTNLQATLIVQPGNPKLERLNSLRAAAELFDRMHGRGRRNRWLAKLTGKSNGLQTLSRIPAADSRRTAGVVVVPLSKIVGSEGRSDDFDAGFNPIKQHNRERWINVAAARWQGCTLPAVELVQVGDLYYVRDGHHRISVAKAMGQLEIDARIMN